MWTTPFVATVLLASLPAGDDALAKPVRSVGEWLRHAPEASIRMKTSVPGGYGGWQTSGMTFDRLTRTWWSIGDQSSETHPQHRPPGSTHHDRYLYRFTQVSPHVEAEPIRIRWECTCPNLDRVRNSFEEGMIDFEGIAADPKKANTFVTCTEGAEPWLIELEYRADQKFAVVTRAARLASKAEHEGDQINKRWEGIAFAPDGETIFLVTEWSQSPSRIYEIPVEAFRREIDTGSVDPPTHEPTLEPVPFVVEGLQGELTGLCFAEYEGKTSFLVLDRNTPSLYFVDWQNPHRVKQRVFLDLRAPALDGRPEGIRIKSASPEGVACDDRGQVILIGDPAGDYFKPLEDGADQKSFAELVPLVFRISLTELLENGP